MKHKTLYLGLLFAISLMWLFSLGGGLWGSDYTIGHWTAKLFGNICHQIPDRSFSFNGAQMAVNSRCFGVFTGLWIGWMLIPGFNRISVDNRKWTLHLLFFAVILQIIDYTGNLIDLWVNTNGSRVLFGFILGIAVSFSLSDFFLTVTNTENNE